MSSKDRAHADAEFERRVCQYLAEHPNFFLRHSRLAEKLEFPHGGEGVESLLQWRIADLRARNEELGSEMRRLVVVARANQRLGLCVHRFALGLIAAEQLAPIDIANIFRRSFRDRFPGVRAHAQLFAERNCVDEDDPRLAGLMRALFSQGKPHCGPFSRAEMTALFGRQFGRVGSALIAPLRARGDNNRPLGLLVLSSDDRRRFAPGMGVMFLTQMSELLECVLSARESPRELSHESQ